jgi:hypothetical protein
MLSNSEYKIHTYQKKYCINDIIYHCKFSFNPTKFIDKIENKILHNSQYYVSKDKICSILAKPCYAKIPKAKELLSYLENPNIDKSKLEIIDIENIKYTNSDTQKNNDIIDFNKNIINYNNKIIKYFYYDYMVYFKLVDIINITNYDNIKQFIDNKDKYTLSNLFLYDTETTNKILEYNIDKINLKTYTKISHFYNNIKNENINTIFINESGLYSILHHIKNTELNLFINNILPKITTNKNKNNYSYDDILDYCNKDCIYILHIKDNIYKYGKSSTIKRRLKDHINILNYNNIERLYILDSMNTMTQMEIDIKNLTKLNKINYNYNNGIEYFECNLDITIDKVIEKIDDLYYKAKKNTKSTDILLEKILGKLNEIDMRLDKLDNIDNRLTVLENQSNKNTSGKCIDCTKETSKFATRCGECEKNNRLKDAMEDGTKPSYEQLQKDLKELRFVSHVAKKYSVTPRTMTRWLANYEKYNKITKKTTQSNEKIPEENKKVTKSAPEKKKVTEPAPEKKENPSNNEKLKKKCMDCDKMVYKKCTRCNECNNKNKIKIKSVESNRPSLEQLKNDLKELKSMVQVGVKYKVSDNAVRKWIKNYEKIAIE